MEWQDKLYNYCERGADAAFWGEPLNAISNIAFVLVGMAAIRQWRRAAPKGRDGLAVAMLSGLTVAIGIGSFLFHTLATRWAKIADVLPISCFMVVYLGFALRSLLGWGWGGVAAAVAAFLAVSLALAQIACGGAGPCLNGSLGYLPALASLVLVGGHLRAVLPGTANALLAAAAIFAVSLGFRTGDMALCQATTVLGTRMGTHVLWHLLNAFVLHLLLQGAIEAGRQDSRATRSRVAGKA